MSLLALSIEKIALGLKTGQQREFRHKSYRELARSKQLPPDSSDYIQRLKDDVDFETGKSALESVRVMGGMDTEGRPIWLSPEEVDLSEWFMWFCLAGRGFGKTWIGASWVNEGAANSTGEYMAVMGRDAHDVRAYCVEGESGILKTAPNHFYPKYEPSKRLITWPNGVKCNLFYAEEPDTVRGPNNFRAWADEPASYQDAHVGLKGENGEDTAMSNLLMTLRKGEPQLLVTGTPKPLKLVKDLLRYKGAIIVRGGTLENRLNLAPIWIREMEEQYEGTRLGRQELHGEVLDDNPGALWQREWIEKARMKTCPVMERIVVGVDPSASSGAESAKTGIIVAGKWWHLGEERYHFFVLEDRSCRGTPKDWATQAVNAYRYHLADRIVAERNNGGEMVESTIRNVASDVSLTTVWASKNKRTRAEPVSALYEQGRIHHVGAFTELEDQQCEWEPGQESPDNMDALVWAITELMDGESAGEDRKGHKEFWDTDTGEMDEDMMAYLLSQAR